MSENDLLPSCGACSLSENVPAHASPDPPPMYQPFPQAFTIGGCRSVAPLVTSLQLRSHLALLGAFANLRVQIEHAKPEVLPLYVPQEVERRWTWFVGMAVERFEKWCLGLENTELMMAQSGTEEWLPPIDVLMVWHAYMLNPGWYTEDCNRIPTLGLLSHLGSYFIATLDGVATYTPSQARIHHWMGKTSQPFDPLEDATTNCTKTLSCPKCAGDVQVPYLNSKGTGYLQGNFFVACPACRLKFRKTHLAMRKFAEDILRGSQSKRDYLAGTLLTPTNIMNFSRAKFIKDTILESNHMAKPTKKSTKSEWILSICEKEHWSFEKLSSKGHIANHAKQLKIGRILSAYSNHTIFSVDLVGAVIRQGSFVKKMQDLCWTDPTFFERSEDEVALHHAIARYHAFLDLLSSTPAGFFVPTLDIDLAWHTHQLMGSRYEKDCVAYVGRFIDHDDKVEESRLSSAFDITCRAWKDRFGVQYSHCGCPLPGETIGQKLSRLVAHRHHTSSSLVPPPRDDFLAATHASDHNATYAYHRRAKSIASQRRRREKIKQRKLRYSSGPASVGSQSRQRCRYDTPFIVPVPIYFGLGGCVAYAGPVIQGGGRGGCAAGAGACGSGDGGICGGGGLACGGGSVGGGIGGDVSGCGGGGCFGGCFL